MYLSKCHSHFVCCMSIYAKANRITWDFVQICVLGKYSIPTHLLLYQIKHFVYVFLKAPGREQRNHVEGDGVGFTAQRYS